jgi:hypothetical protein
VRPINDLTDVAIQVAAGNLDQVAIIKRNDQIGTLAQSFNTMTGRLRDLIDSLETRVEMRTAQVEASADVGRAVTSILDPDQLLQQVAQLITERFGFYYAAVFTIDPNGQWAMLREAAGPSNAAWLLKQAGHRLELNGNSMVAACVRNKRACIALDVGTEAVRFANPLLPDTRLVGRCRSSSATRCWARWTCSQRKQRRSMTPVRPSCRTWPTRSPSR